MALEEAGGRLLVVDRHPAELLRACLKLSC
jgi:hypothetical protein